ncbi:MAG: hypothetical protein KA314_20855 [Chloroflexi bacterium]|jgi:hypothetical protein|nr:hypothetical protein [Chloroflexota bacterium]MBP8058289.1 hypothetical protein [Chloroflexota bacterium]
MITTINSASTWDNDQEEMSQPLQETTGGGEHEQVWEIVARTQGLLEAQIKAGRLQAEGLPARAWAESAGVAIGLTVGLLGTGYVSVPEKLAEQAREILAITLDEEE